MLPTFSAERLAPEILLQLTLGVVGQRLDVAVRCSGRDNEHVGDNEKLRHIKQDNIEALLIIDRGGCHEGSFDGF